MTTECPGRCNDEWRTAEAKTAETGEAHELTVTAGAPVWCAKCAANILSVLHDLPDLWIQLDADKGRRTGAQESSTVRVQTEVHASPSPEYDEQDWFIRWVLWTYEEWGRELFAQPARTDARTDLTSVLRWHHGNAERMLQTDGPDTPGLSYGSALLRERGKLRGRTKTGSGFAAKKLPCPRCEQKRLVHEIGTDYIVCQNKACGRMVTLAEYDELARVVAA